MRPGLSVFLLLALAAATYPSGALAGGPGKGCEIDHEKEERRLQKDVARCAADASAECRRRPARGEAAEQDDDQDRARDALNRREIKPLPDVLAAAAKAQPGEVVSVKLECNDHAWVYELRIITKDRRRHDIYVNATTLDVTRDD